MKHKVKKKPEYIIEASRDVFAIYKSIDHTAWGSDCYSGVLIEMDMDAAYSCCGFPELSSIFINAKTWKKVQPMFPQLATTVAKGWAKNKMQFVVAYVPDVKKWKYTHLFLTALGFKRSISIPTRMNGSKYTNTRYEWFTPGTTAATYRKEQQFESDVPTLNV